jgi:sedoheptulokinase
MGSYTGYGAVTDFYNRVNHIRPESAVAYCTIHDYFVMQLTGIKKPLVHITDAASFGCYDIFSNSFKQEVPFDTVFDYAVAGLYQGIPVSVAIGDNQASVLSTLADHANVLVNVGTGSQISVISSEPVYAANVETRPYFDGKYLIVGSALCGGRAYSVLKDFYKQVLSYTVDVTDDQVYAIMDRMLSEPGASVKVDTHFAGTRADPSVRGGIYAISTENFTPQAIARGVLEGMISELYSMYILMNSPKTGLVCSGNGIRKNKHLSQLAENVFACKMKVPAHMEEAAFGAAMFGAIWAGVFLDSNQAQSLISYI